MRSVRKGIRGGREDRERVRRLCYLCGRSTKLHMPGFASAQRGGPSEETRISRRLGPHVNVWDEQQLRCA